MEKTDLVYSYNDKGNVITHGAICLVLQRDFIIHVVKINTCTYIF